VDLPADGKPVNQMQNPLLLTSRCDGMALLSIGSRSFRTLRGSSNV
jgi:hypothetical protein